MYDNTTYCHTSIDSCKCMGVKGSLAAVQFIKSGIFLPRTSQVRIYISTTSQARTHIRYYKPCALHLNINKIEGLYDEIIITILPSYAGRNYTTYLLPLVFLLVLYILTIQTAANLWYSFVHLHNLLHITWPALLLHTTWLCSCLFICRYT